MNTSPLEGPEGSGWWTGSVTCQMCGHEWIGVWPEDANTVALECSECGAIAGMPDPPEEPEK